MDIAKTETITVKQLFSLENNNKYMIPKYQRKYSWKKKEINELFEDILRVFKK